MSHELVLTGIKPWLTTETVVWVGDREALIVIALLFFITYQYDTLYFIVLLIFGMQFANLIPVFVDRL